MAALPDVGVQMFVQAMTVAVAVVGLLLEEARRRRGARSPAPESGVAMRGIGRIGRVGIVSVDEGGDAVSSSSSADADAVGSTTAREQLQKQNWRVDRDLHNLSNVVCVLGGLCFCLNTKCASWGRLEVMIEMEQSMLCACLAVSVSAHIK